MDSGSRLRICSRIASGDGGGAGGIPSPPTVAHPQRNHHRLRPVGCEHQRRHPLAPTRPRVAPAIAAVPLGNNSGIKQPARPRPTWRAMDLVASSERIIGRVVSHLPRTPSSTRTWIAHTGSRRAGRRRSAATPGDRQPGGASRIPGQKVQPARARAATPNLTAAPVRGRDRPGKAPGEPSRVDGD
jgi:hypothetical protein